MPGRASRAHPRRAYQDLLAVFVLAVLVLCVLFVLAVVVLAVLAVLVLAEAVCAAHGSEPTRASSSSVATASITLAGRVKQGRGVLYGLTTEHRLDQAADNPCGSSRGAHNYPPPNAARTPTQAAASRTQLPDALYLR